MLIDILYVVMFICVILMCMIIWIGYIFLDNKLRYNKGYCRKCRNELMMSSINHKGICEFNCPVCEHTEEVIMCVVDIENYKWSKKNGK